MKIRRLPAGAILVVSLAVSVLAILGCLAIDLALVLVLCATHYSAAVTINGDMAR